jgi:hypothetical protein
MTLSRATRSSDRGRRTHRGRPFFALSMPARYDHLLERAGGAGTGPATEIRIEAKSGGSSGRHSRKRGSSDLPASRWDFSAPVRAFAPANAYHDAGSYCHRSSRFANTPKADIRLRCLICRDGPGSDSCTAASALHCP